MSWTSNIFRHPRMRTHFLLACVMILGFYMLLFESSQERPLSIDSRAEAIYTMDEYHVERALNNSHKVEEVEYVPPFKGILKPLNEKQDEDQFEKQKQHYHRLWMWADSKINGYQMFDDNDDVLQILEALHSAPIVSADVYDVGTYESGTSEKWVITLLGGQKAMMKLIW